MKKPQTARRPLPPASLGEWEGGAQINFLPARDVRDWLVDTFISDDGPLFNEDHKHLLLANFEVLWAAGSFARQGRTVIGQAEEVAFRVGGWQRDRQIQQMFQWFGQVPDYLLTFDGSFARDASDAEWCALVEHELYHVGHKLDEFGAPRFTREGLPVLFIKAHDIEEFVGVVERYGVGTPDGAMARAVKAAKAGPTVSRLRLQQGCGTCMLRAA